MKLMHVRIADSTTVVGVAGSFMTSLINTYSPSEWMVIGIIVGIICSVVGCIAGIALRFARLWIWRDYVRSRQAVVAELDEEELKLADSDRD